EKKGTLPAEGVSPAEGAGRGRDPFCDPPEYRETKKVAGGLHMRLPCPLTGATASTCRAASGAVACAGPLNPKKIATVATEGAGHVLPPSGVHAKRFHAGRAAGCHRHCRGPRRAVDAGPAAGAAAGGQR